MCRGFVLSGVGIGDCFVRGRYRKVVLLVAGVGRVFC